MECEIRLETEKPEQDICLEPEAYNQASGGKIKITKNGNYDVTKFQEADVAVDPPTETIRITENGEHDVSNYAKAIVDVPLPNDLFNKDIVATSSVQYNVLLHKLINWESPDIPDVWEFDLAVYYASELFRSSGFKNLILKGKVDGTSIASMFQGCPLLESVVFKDFDLGKVSNATAVFSQCPKLTSIDLHTLDTSKITQMGSIFNGCSSLTDLDLSTFDTSSVTSMSYMFQDCSSLKYVNLSGWTSNSRLSTVDLFNRCSALTAVVIDSPVLFKLSSGNTFRDTPIEDGGTGFIYVPDILVNEYKSATNWSIHADQIKPLSELPQEVKDAFHMEQ